MFRSVKSRVGVLAVTETMVGLPMGLATPAGAAPNPDRCLSINGLVVYQFGTAQCTSDRSTGSQPNVAIATANNSNAFAVAGNGLTATAVGNGNTVGALSVDDSTAVAIGGCTISSTGGTFRSCHP